jgi:hypothetical protein
MSGKLPPLSKQILLATPVSTVKKLNLNLFYVIPYSLGSLVRGSLLTSILVGLAE